MHTSSSSQLVLTMDNSTLLKSKPKPTAKRKAKDDSDEGRVAGAGREGSVNPLVVAAKKSKKEVCSTRFLTLSAYWNLFLMYSPNRINANVCAIYSPITEQFSSFVFLFRSQWRRRNRWSSNRPRTFLTNTFRSTASSAISISSNTNNSIPTSSQEIPRLSFRCVTHNAAAKQKQSNRPRHLTYHTRRRSRSRVGRRRPHDGVRSPLSARSRIPKSQSCLQLQLLCGWAFKHEYTSPDIQTTVKIANETPLDIEET